MRKLMFIPAALLAVAASSFAFAHEGPGPGPGNDGWHHPHHALPFVRELHHLNLNDSQKADIKQLVKTSFEQMRPRMKAARQQRQAFEALSPDSPDYSAAAQALAQTEASAASARVLQLTALKQQIYQRLTAAQKQQLAAMQTADQALRQARMQQWKADHPQGDEGHRDD
ncbi:MAG: Spy/CpxP family protein refolding chaperone [Stenotrophobium sp.]